MVQGQGMIFAQNMNTQSTIKFKNLKKVKLEIDGSTFKLEQGDKKRNLIIDAKSSSIFGKYECVAKNELTESRTGEILLYQGIPTPAREYILKCLI